MPKAIVAIGGGEIRTRGTLDIDLEIIRLSNKRRPKIVFIPTASSDSPRYCRRFSDYFGGFLDCKTDALFLVSEQPPAREIERKINVLRHRLCWRREHTSYGAHLAAFRPGQGAKGSVRSRNRLGRHQRRLNMLVRFGPFRFD